MAGEKTELTESQQELADLLISTKIEAPVKRLRWVDGKPEIYQVTKLMAPFAFSEHPEEFALKLHEEDPHAPLSPFYINLRNLPPHLLTKVAENIAEIHPDQKVDFCTGIPKAGDPIAAEYAKVTGVELVSVFGKEETSAGRRIVGVNRAPNDRKNLLIIDDLITRAHTKIEAIHAAEALGYNVVGVAVLFDREQGGAEEMEKKGYKLYAALKFSPTLEHYRQTGQITYGQYIQIRRYLGK